MAAITLNDAFCCVSKSNKQVGTKRSSQLSRQHVIFRQDRRRKSSRRFNDDFNLVNRPVQQAILGGLPAQIHNVQVQTSDASAGDRENNCIDYPFFSLAKSLVFASTCLRPSINTLPRPLETPSSLPRPSRLARCSRCCKSSLPRPCRQASGRKTLRRRVRCSGMYYLQTTRDKMVPG